MKFGLEQNIVDNLIAVFEQHTKVDKAFIFGSRAKGNYRPDSDIDIAIEGIDIITDDIIAMSVAFEEKGIEHKIDLINYDTIKEPALKDHIDRVGIEFYRRWKEFELGKVANIQTGPFGSLLHASDYVSVGIPTIMPTNIGQRLEIQRDNLSFIKDEDALRLQRYLVQENDIVYSRRGDVEKCAFITQNESGWLCGTGCLRIRFNSNTLLPKYCAYFLSTEEIKGWVTNNAVGSTMLNLNSIVLSNLPLRFPPVQEQSAIAAILSSLDDKIDLLHRQNKTLEQLAETLFRQWFVEEAEESWEVELLGKVFDIGIGRTPPRKEQYWFTLNPNDIKWVSIKDMGTSGIYLDGVSEYLTQNAIEQFSIPIIPKNTVMLSFKMTIGRLAIATEKMVSNEAIAHFKRKEGSFLFPEFLYLFLKTYSWVELGSTSSIVESINSQMIKEIEIIIPEKQKIVDFEELIKPTFEKIKSNQIQIRTLTKTRDTLLPKLMSGKVRVQMSEP